MQNATQPIMTQRRSSRRTDFHRLTRPRYPLLQALMRTLLVVVLDELPEHVFQMTLPEDEQVVEELAACCATNLSASEFATGAR